MITIQVDESPDEKWNERLLTTNTGIIYHTKEYARFVEQKGWKPKFLKFLELQNIEDKKVEKKQNKKINKKIYKKKRYYKKTK